MTEPLYRLPEAGELPTADMAPSFPVVIRTTDNRLIPCVDGNMDYKDFQDWNAEQETPLILE